MNKRLEALNALADIRDYLRKELQYRCGLPDDLVDKFNLVAQRLGADSDWCNSDWRDNA